MRQPRAPFRLLARPTRAGGRIILGLAMLGPVALAAFAPSTLADDGDPTPSEDGDQVVTDTGQALDPDETQLDDVDPVRLALFPARVKMAKGYHDEAVDLLEDALIDLRADHGEESPEYARGLDLRFEIQWRSGNTAISDHDRLEGDAKDAIGILEAAGDEHAMTLASVLNNWGNVVQIEGDLDRAREIYMRCYAIRESVEGPEGRSVATVLNNLAMLQMAEEQHFQAEVSLRQNLAILEKHFADFPEREAMATCLNNLGMVVARQGRIEEGIEHIRKAIEIRTTRLGEDHIATARAWENLGGMLYQVDRLEEARDAFAETVRIYDKYYEEDDVLFEANPLTSLGLVYAELGEEAAALDYLDRALSIRRTRLEADDPELAVAIGLVGRYLWSIGDRDQARSLLEEAYAIESQNGVDEAGRTPALGQLPWVRVEGDADAEVRVDGSAEAILVAVPVADAGRTVAVNGPDGHELVRAELDLAQRGRPHAFLLVSPGEPLPPGRYEVVRGKNGDAVSGFVLRAAS